MVFLLFHRLPFHPEGGEEEEAAGDLYQLFPWGCQDIAEMKLLRRVEQDGEDYSCCWKEKERNHVVDPIK